jgi:K(+)-stimulated pyrophosphate-energized sodium pump
MNPVIKFTTLFGLLAVELAVRMSETASGSTLFIAGAFLAIAMVFVVRSFYGMRIRSESMPASK